MNSLDLSSLSCIVVYFFGLDWTIGSMGRISLALRGLRSLRIANMLILLSSKSSKSMEMISALACTYIRDMWWLKDDLDGNLGGD